MQTSPPSCSSAPHPSHHRQTFFKAELHPLLWWLSMPVSASLLLWGEHRLTSLLVIQHRGISPRAFLGEIGLRNDLPLSTVNC